MDQRLIVPQGELSLTRPHVDGAEPLRAWDAADEYVLHHLHDAPVGKGHWLVVNDAFGALAVALAAQRPASWTDSCVAMAATEANLAGNGIDPAAVDLVPSTAEPAGPFDVVVVKIPRTLAFLDDQLRRLRPHLHAGSIVVGAAMTKAVHRSTIAAFESIIGPTPTTRARKKARLLLATVDPGLDPGPSPAPARWTTDDGVTVTGLANAFSATGLDAGTRLLLDHLPTPTPGTTVVDLGCGTGVIGATLVHRQPDIDLVCCDESFQAVASARETVGGQTDRAAFHVTDVLDGVDDASVDLVVVNPPFHAAGARTTTVAQEMFAQSRRVLRPDGALVVVANRHLGHHVALRRWFASVEVVASDPRFVVLRGRGVRA